DISGALWDEDTFVISLEEGHYAAYIKNYMAMQIIFGSGVATGREAEEAVSDMLLKNNDPTHHLCCFVVFGLFEVFSNQLYATLDLVLANINNYFIFTSPSLATLDLLFGLHSCLLFEVFLVF
ncbi:hypothetical protein ACJX0J_023337, partial [Zea mays]